MIARTWHGYTSIEKAFQYENLFRRDVLSGLERITGFKGAQLLRKNYPNEVEFITIIYFDNVAAVIAFAGEDYAKAVIPKEIGEVLAHFDERVIHYDLVEISITNDFIKQNLSIHNEK